MRGFMALGIAALVSSGAWAQEPAATPPPSPPPVEPLPPPPPAPLAASNEPATVSDDVQHRVSITVSPIHLILPIVEVTGEFRVADKVGVAGIAGAGTIPQANSSPPLFGLELGGQFRYYVLGSFIHGLQLGAELLLAHVRGSIGAATGAGTGISISPFLGYKIASNVGFTFDAQLGPSFNVAGASASQGGQTASASNSGVGVLLNLNIGWSF